MSALHDRFRLKALVLSALLIATCTVAALAERPCSAEDFVRFLYARYPKKDGEVSIAFAENLSRWFTRPLLPSLARDNRYAERTRSIGGLDWDPLCDCQDDDGLRLLSVRSENNTRNAAIVIARIWLPVTPGYGGRNEGEVRFALRHTAEGWRIADIGDAGRPSLNGMSLAVKLAATEYAQ